MSESGLVLFSVENHVALITVNDPGRRNAVSAEMSVLLRVTVERAEADPDVHAVVVTGAGKAFCAGADLSALGAAGDGSAESGLLRIYDGFMAVGACRLPTIAAVNGRPQPPRARWCWRPRPLCVPRRVPGRWTTSNTNSPSA